MLRVSVPRRDDLTRDASRQQQRGPTDRCTAARARACTCAANGAPHHLAAGGGGVEHTPLEDMVTDVALRTFGRDQVAKAAAR
jgi:hypothetical protein